MDKVKDIIQTIDNWAVSDPDRIVYQSESQTFTYKDLKEQSDSIAAYLLNEVKEDGPIVVYGGQEFEMIATFVGCSKAGRAYIPIETHTPVERLDMIINVAEPALILYMDSWVELETKAEAVLVDVVPEYQLDTYPGLQDDDTYYIIFTSGTTGVPKGVQISHGNLKSFVNWELSDFYLEEGKRFLSQAPFSFDLSVMSVYPALASGGSLAPLTKETINDFKKLFAVLPTMNLNVWVSTPSFMDICLMEPTFDAKHNPTLTHFLFCGEELPRQTAIKLKERFPEAYLYNTYGPTEATVAVTRINVTEEVLADFDRIPIGYVKEDTKIVIVDEDLNPLPAGEMGEIIIVGPSVSKGYLHNEEKTKEAFFEYEGERAYHTGDAGRMTEDGLLLYGGRMDFQIKLHGYRMELEDIDHHLNEVSYIGQAAAVPKYKDGKVQQLIAYVVVKDNPFEKDYQLTKAIKKELAETVMDYMIPQRFVYVDHLELTQNGKIDRKGLINEVNNG